MEGTTGSASISGAGGNDVIVVSRHQYADAVIDDASGANTVKFDYGVEIISFSDTVLFGTVITEATVTLASGAVITISSPAQQGQYQYQFGDGAVMDYAVFKAALTAGGVDSATGTLTTSFTVDYPSDYGPTFPDPVIDLSTYNYIEGTDGDDTLTGTDGNDYFHNLGGGRDTANGGEGNDLFLSGRGFDTFNGGEGIDTISYANATSGVNAELKQGGPFGGGNATVTGAARDNFTSIENLIGSDFNDVLKGNQHGNQLEGGAGDDRFNGGNSGTNILYGGAGDDTLDGASNGGSHNTLIGGADADSFWLVMQSRVTDIIRDFTPDDGDKVRIAVHPDGDRDSLDRIFSNHYVLHQSTTIEDHTGNGKLDTVMKFNPSNNTTIPDEYYTLILESFTAPFIFDYINVSISWDVES